jgi:hypothetical protein
MSKHDPIDFSGKQFFDHGGGRVIGKMSVPGLDPLFHRPRPMSVALQQFFVVVSFNHERVHVPKPFHDHLGGVTQVGDKPEAARSGIKREADGIDRVMRHRKRLHKDVANLELGAGAKYPPVPMSIQGVVGADGLGRLRVRINRHREFATEHFQAANVIAVLVSEQNTVELFRHHAALLKPEHNLPRAQSAIDQNFAMIGRDERTVPGTAAPEHRQTEHDRYLATGC